VASGRQFGSRSPSSAFGFSIDEISGVLALINRRDRASDDLPGLRLREGVDEQLARGRNGFPCSSPTSVRRSSRRSSLGSMWGSSTTYATTAVPVVSSGTPTAAAWLTASWSMSTPSISAGPTFRPATFKASSARPWEPEAVCVLLCEVAVVPQILPRRPVLLQIALVARPQRLRHRGTGVARDEVAALARLFDRLATLVDDIDVHPEPRTAQRAGFQRLVRHWHEEAAADLRAARDVDDRAVAAADRVVEPAPRFGIPRLAGRAQDSE